MDEKNKLRSRSPPTRRSGLLRGLRKEASARGLDPNVWFARRTHRRREIARDRAVVSNIYKYTSPTSWWTTGRVTQEGEGCGGLMSERRPREVLAMWREFRSTLPARDRSTVPAGSSSAQWRERQRRLSARRIHGRAPERHHALSLHGLVAVAQVGPRLDVGGSDQRLVVRRPFFDPLATELATYWLPTMRTLRNPFRSRWTGGPRRSQTAQRRARSDRQART